MLVLARHYLNIWIDRPFESEPPSLGPPQAALRDSPPQAFFVELGAQPLVLYRDSSELRLWEGRQPLSLNALRLEHRRIDESQAMLQILGPDLDRRLTYAIVGMIEDDFITMTDPEDFDFGLFLANVRANPDRQALLFAPDQTTP